jgi:spore coat protein U-like protein
LSRHFANRKLKIAGTDPDTLVYNLYTDGANHDLGRDGTVPPGNGTGAGMGSGSLLRCPSTERLLASENDGLGKAGLYNDTIVATITY